MNRILVVVLLALAAHAGSATAQALEGEYGAACANLTSNSLQVQTTQTIPANSTIMATAALSNGFAFSNQVADPISGVYDNGAIGIGSIIVFPAFHHTAKALPSGTTITYSMVGGVGSNACLTISAFALAANLINAEASNGGNGATQTLTTSTVTETPNLIYMGVAYAADPGTLTPDLGTMLTKTCGGTAPPLCVAASFRTANDLGPFTQTVHSQNSVAWEAALNAFAEDRIFADGFQ